MGKSPNAADITRALALLGGGAKKDGGDGMLGGIKNIFEKGILIGRNSHLQEQEQKNEIEQTNEKIENQEI